MRVGLLGSLEGLRFRQETARKEEKEGEGMPMTEPCPRDREAPGDLPALKLSFTGETRVFRALPSAKD